MGSIVVFLLVALPPLEASLRFTRDEKAFGDIISVLMGREKPDDTATPVEPPKCALVIPDKEAKVVIVASFADAIVPRNLTLMRADWELAGRLTQLLEERFKENRERVKIVSQSQLKSYTNAHPRWPDEAPQEIGKHFGADWVITLEINSLSLVDHGGANLLYHGAADIEVTLTDVHKPVGECLVFVGPCQLRYPKTPVERTEMGMSQFRAKFINNIAENLVGLIAAHPPRDHFGASPEELPPIASPRIQGHDKPSAESNKSFNLPWKGMRHAQERDKTLSEELVAILDQTQSPDAFLATVMVLQKTKAEARVVVPAILRNAERLRIYETKADHLTGERTTILTGIAALLEKGGDSAPVQSCEAESPLFLLKEHLIRWAVYTGWYEPPAPAQVFSFDSGMFR